MLLDTGIVIDVLRGHAAASAFIDALDDRPSVSAVTVAEIHAGLRSQRAEQMARRVFNACTKIAVTPDIAELAGNLMRHYKASHDFGIADALIAATAEHHELRLATLNVKHFPMFKRLKPAYRCGDQCLGRPQINSPNFQIDTIAPGNSIHAPPPASVASQAAQQALARSRTRRM